MSVYRSSGDVPPNNQQFHPFTNMPPPPLPPRFPPTIITPPSFNHPSFTNCPPYPSQPIDSRVTNRPTYPSPSWGGYSPARDTVNQSTLIRLVTQDSENSQDWVNHWVKNKGIRCGSVSRSPKKEIKIYVVKEKLNDALRAVRELENAGRTLSVMLKTVSPQEWEQKCQEIEGIKKELVTLISELQLTEEEFKALREKCSKRSKKRARLRRRSDALKRQKEEEKLKIQNLHFQIDNWQKEMQEGVERIQREEEMKKEADAVLWGVTQKKTEAKRQVAMLSALLTLRSVRVARLAAAGQNISQSQIDTFNTVIERLKKMWSRHLDECLLEEQALRGMLGEAVTKEDPLKTHKKLVLNKWENALFGSIGTLDSTLKSDQLVQIRREWDRFAVQEPSLLASPVPPGYVLPVPPSSPQWQSLLKY